MSPVSPNLNTFVERFIQTIQQESLDHFVVVGLAHLNYIVREFVHHYPLERPHEGLDNELLVASLPSDFNGDIVCDERLGGLLKSYRRAA